MGGPNDERNQAPAPVTAGDINRMTGEQALALVRQLAAAQESGVVAAERARTGAPAPAAPYAGPDLGVEIPGSGVPVDPGNMNPLSQEYRMGEGRGEVLTFDELAARMGDGVTAQQADRQYRQRVQADAVGAGQDTATSLDPGAELPGQDTSQTVDFVPSVPLPAGGAAGVISAAHPGVQQAMQVFAGVPGAFEVRGDQVVFGMDFGDHLRRNRVISDNAWRNLTTALAPAESGGPAGNTLVQLDIERAINAAVPEELLREAGDLAEKLRQAQREGLAGQLDLNQTVTEGTAALAQLQHRFAEDLEQREAGRGVALRERLARVDAAIERVRNNRVDPDAFFRGPGGDARRIGSAVAMAVSGIGSLFGGGPNMALQILDDRINQNIQAQMANQAQDRAAAGMEQTAFAQFRSILGDERAAEAATRAALWEEATRQLQSQVSSARRPIIRANGTSLILAAQVQAMAARIEAIRNSVSGTEAFHVRQRMQVDNPRRLVSSLTGAGAPQTPSTGGAATSGSPRPRTPQGGSGGQQQRPTPRVGLSRPFGTLDRQERAAQNVAIEAAGASSEAIGMPLQLPNTDANRAAWNRLESAEQRTAASEDVAALDNIRSSFATLRALREEAGGWDAVWRNTATNGRARVALQTIRQLAATRGWQMGALTGGEGETIERIFPDETTFAAWARRFAGTDDGRVTAQEQQVTDLLERNLAARGLRASRTLLSGPQR